MTSLIQLLFNFFIIFNISMKAKAAQPKAPEKKQWRAEDYASLTIPIE